jgi:hypothetical protein
MINDKIFTGKSDEPKAAKEQASTLLKDIFESDDFNNLLNLLLGLHSSI